MATYALQPPTYAFGYTGVGPEYEKVTVSASATYARGDLLLKTNNAVTVCGSDPTIISYLSQSANTDSVPGESTVAVIRVKPEDTFEMSLYNSTPASATCADADLDGQTTYGITLATVSGVSAWTLDTSNAGASVKRVQLVGRVPNYTASDLYPRVYAKFLSSVVTYQ